MFDMGVTLLQDGRTALMIAARFALVEVFLNQRDCGYSFHIYIYITLNLFGINNDYNNINAIIVCSLLAGPAPLHPCSARKCYRRGHCRKHYYP